MGVKVYTFKNNHGQSLDHVGNELADWLLSNHNFSIKKKEWENNNTYLVHVNKSGFFRSIAGLVFEYKIELSATDSSVVASIDDGDIRKQLAAAGVALFVAWPVLVTAGVGMYASGDFVKDIHSKIERILA